MDENPKELYSADQDFAQFVDRYGLVASDPKAHEEYNRWRIERILEVEEQEIRRVEAYANGYAKSYAKGVAKTQSKIALKAFSDARSDADLSEIEKTLVKFGVPKDVIKSARERVKAKLDEKM
jgi:hypothetical protein